MNAPHIPVMLNEMITALKPQDGDIYVDGTFGAGGYSRAILNAAQCRVIALDRDAGAYAFAKTLEQEFPARFALIVGRFSQMCELLAAHGVQSVNGIVLDLGVSSMQLDTADRGFSFRSDGPLDMRMGREGMTAAEAVNTLEEVELADILYNYGEERASRRIAKAIIGARALQPIQTTAELADIVRRVVPKSGKTDPATRTFQALRIYVNDELGELEEGLEAATRLLAPGGRLVVVTFHSLEDRMVKLFTHSRCGKLGGDFRHRPEGHLADQAVTNPPIFFRESVKKYGVTDAEAEHNPRARSAMLRTAIRTEAVL